MKTEISISRRIMIQNIALATAGIGLAQRRKILLDLYNITLGIMLI